MTKRRIFARFALIYKKVGGNGTSLRKVLYLCNRILIETLMSYSQMAQLELLNALNSITSEAELNEFKNLLAHYFAQKAQKAIDALWDEGVINDQTIEQWGAEHMRTP